VGGKMLRIKRAGGGDKMNESRRKEKKSKRAGGKGSESREREEEIK